jgi:hypothetical protein
MLGQSTVVAAASSHDLHAAKQSVPWMRIHAAVDVVQGSRKIHSFNAAKTVRLGDLSVP